MRVEIDGGEVIELGTTATAPTIGIVDYSRRVTDDFGVTTVVPRGFSRLMSVRLAVPFNGVDALQRRLANLRATSALWIADDRYSSFAVRGFYKDFNLDLAVPPLSFCTVTIEGLAESTPMVDDGTDPAPVGRASTFHLLQPFTVASGDLVVSNVAEDDEDEWSPGTNYALGARAILASTHRIYESAIPSNVGHDPLDATGQWVDVGATNRWAMFDQALGSETSAAGSITVTLDAGAVDAVALLDVTAATVRVQAPGLLVQDPDYDETVAVGAGAITFLDLPGADGQITVTITGPGQVAVGTLLVGRLVALGVTEASPTAGITDFSKKDVDDFGEVAIVERAWSKRMTARALIRTDKLDVVAGRIAAVRAVPALWIGDAGLDSLTIYGFFKDFSIEVGETVSKLSLSIEGLSKAAPLPAPEPAVRWVGDWSADERYPRNAIVRYLGRSFASLVDKNLGHQPPASATDDAYWYAVSDRGDDGSNGVPGAPGANGQTSYVHFAWANSADGSTGFSTTVSAGKLYLGVYTDFNAPDSANPALYSWTLIKGDNGLQGPQGTPGNVGANGQTSYFHVAYADSANGATNFTTGDPGARTYIGVYVDFTPADSNSPGAYTWSKYRGEDGSNGTPGAPGANGQPSYVHFAWANAADGSSGFSTTVSTGKLYIGVYSDFIEADSNNPALYSWSKIKGDDGLQGPQGTPGSAGANGQTSYVHFAYADSADGTANFTTGAAGGRYYIGTYTDFTAADSGNPAAYTWSLQRGADGANGTPGAPGSNGQPSYVHIAYATNASGTTGFHLSDPTGRTYIGVYTDFTLADSSNPALYTWSLIKGSDGTPGAPGTSAKSMDVAASALNFAAEYTGAIKAGQQPRTVQATFLDGATNVSGSTAWSIIDSANCSASVNSAGLVTINSVTGDGYAIVQGVYGGVPISKRINFTRTMDAAPPAGPTSLSVGLQGVKDATTTYPAGVSHPVLTVTANGSGQLQVAYALGYYADAFTGGASTAHFFNIEGQARYRLAGSGAAWSSFTAGAVNGISSSSPGYNIEPASEGALEIYQTQSGLSAGVQYEVSVAIRTSARLRSAQADYWGTLTVKQP